MKISYNWLKEFIPGIPVVEQLSAILTAIGLEVEDVERFEEISGSLAGLIVGEIIKCEAHPAADKLKVTEVDLGNGNLVQIVCGAPNAAAGQKVVVAPAGSTIYPLHGNPLTLKKVKIRGMESNGMICAEDEIGIGTSHGGIVELPAHLLAGSLLANWLKPEIDWIYEIGLTPNRIDAMSHIGVAKDVCAYLSHHTRKKVSILSPKANEFKKTANGLPINVSIQNSLACERYAGVSIINVKVGPSPKWMQTKLKSIGVRPINNIVDITNFILHETGQPLHAFDLRAIKENKVIIKNLPAETLFAGLDEKERKLHSDDIMICNGAAEPMCMGGVFGGLHSGVKNATTEIFLESAWFNPAIIRRTSLRHNLRTEAAIRFEKGVDISQTAEVLKKAIMLMQELTGGEISSDIIDIYPHPKQRPVVTLQNKYLKKLTGKEYNRNEVKNILENLGFEIEKEDAESLTTAVPLSKPDITLAADVVEEIIRIDGFDNIEIPSAITLTPALETNTTGASLKENIAHYLTGAGFSEIFTNSLTNSKYYDQGTLANSVKILNSLSADLDIMRPSLMETGLETIHYNVNRKNNNLLFYEFGSTYALVSAENYLEQERLCLYISGNKNHFGWKEKPVKADIYFLKGLCENIFRLCGLTGVKYANAQNSHLESSLSISLAGEVIGALGVIKKTVLKNFEIKQLVLFADLHWANILQKAKTQLVYTEISKFPAVQRDLSVVVNTNTSYEQIEAVVQKSSLEKLTGLSLFDVFESEKLGINKKAFAITLTFTDTEKTLTDKEVDSWMKALIDSFTIELKAEIRN